MALQTIFDTALPCTLHTHTVIPLIRVYMTLPHRRIDLNYALIAILADHPSATVAKGVDTVTHITHLHLELFYQGLIGPNVQQDTRPPRWLSHDMIVVNGYSKHGADFVAKGFIKALNVLDTESDESLMIVPMVQMVSMVTECTSSNSAIPFKLLNAVKWKMFPENVIARKMNKSLNYEQWASLFCANIENQNIPHSILEIMKHIRRALFRAVIEQMNTAIKRINPAFVPSISYLRNPLSLLVKEGKNLLIMVSAAAHAMCPELDDIRLISPLTKKPFNSLPAKRTRDVYEPPIHYQHCSIPYYDSGAPADVPPLTVSFATLSSDGEPQYSKEPLNSKTSKKKAALIKMKKQISIQKAASVDKSCEDEPVKKCEKCGKSPPKLKICSRCLNTRYCSAECQKND